MNSPFDTDPASLVGGMPDSAMQILRFDNGYVVVYTEIPKMPEVNPEDVEPPADADKMMDDMIDGIGAFLRRINDHGAGDDWKGSEDREKLRKGFKAMFPGFTPPGHGHGAVLGAAMPVQKRLVFESKEKLLAFLYKMLPEGK